MTTSPDIAKNLDWVRTRVRRAELEFQRPAGSVRLLAVGKSHPAAALRIAAAAGQREFGENYLQEAEAKISALADLPLSWHYIGPIQSNKTRRIATLFDWVHSVDRERIAARLNEARRDNPQPLNVCVQVNISGEETKSGVSPADLPGLAGFIAGCESLRLRGLMVIPALETGFDRQRHTFRLARELYDSLIDSGLALDTLSMGMSDDLEAAVAEGSTLVRIGTAIFGPRGS